METFLSKDTSINNFEDPISFSRDMSQIVKKMLRHAILKNSSKNVQIQIQRRLPKFNVIFIIQRYVLGKHPIIIFT